MTAVCLIVALLQPYNLGLIDFPAILLLLQQNQKHTVVQILTHVPCLDIGVGSNGKSSGVSEKLLVYIIFMWRTNLHSH